MVVEITPIGIQNLGWRFYIVWIALNAAMVPAVYFFYPETAGRTLEDIDEYYRTDPPLLVFRDKEAISRKRPERYRIKEEEIIRKNNVGATADPAIEMTKKDGSGDIQHQENVGN
jgi:hypothetical protein